ncbi:MAG TPA: Wzz/FepE/Etk N-terminal domain-containing protein [Vicinamibacterales bacterium]|jgi:uncharacterized protein involved in exopolysaccharide biosynthesis|nr:Wzz/FepE/Etk N-terminal domain-containing protein [Vicinamibacterales bacterium]
MAPLVRFEANAREVTPNDGASAPPRTVSDVRAVLRRHFRLIALCFVALAGGAIAAVLMATPLYEGEMKILVKRDRADSVVTGAPAEAAPQRGDMSEAELLSQVELIKANDLLEKVATEAGLVQRVADEGRATSDAEQLALAMKALRRDLIVTPIRRTWLIDVTYRSKERPLARNVLDTLMRLYLEKHLTLHRPSGTYHFFSDQVDRARQELQAAQDRVVQFSRENRVVSAALEKQAALQKLAEFEGMRAQAAAALAETTQRLSAVSTELTRVPSQRTSQVRVTDNAYVMQDVNSRILTLELKRTELLQRFTPEYRGVVEIDQQLREAKAALAAARGAPVREETVADNPTRQWLDTELARTQTDNAALGARVQALSTTVGEYRARAQALEVQDAEQTDLVRALKTAEEKYRLYIEKQEQARISDELDRTRIANVVVAQAPAVAFEAKRSPSLAMLPLLVGAALILSFAVGFVAEALVPAAAVPELDRPRLESVLRGAVASGRRLSASLDALKVVNDALEARLIARTQPQIESAPERPTRTRCFEGVIPVGDAHGLT